MGERYIHSLWDSGLLLHFPLGCQTLKLIHSLGICGLCYGLDLCRWTSYITRGMTGDTFFRIPEDGSCITRGTPSRKHIHGGRTRSHSKYSHVEMISRHSSLNRSWRRRFASEIIARTNATKENQNCLLRTCGTTDMRRLQLCRM